jgi:hypothetical protein
MTANKANHATSYNSVPTVADRGSENVTPTRDPRLRTVAQYISNRKGAVTLSEIATEAGWTRSEADDHVCRMRNANLVQLLDDLQEPVLLLTADGERFAHGSDL